jgi:hypothetical protein
MLQVMSRTAAWPGCPTNDWEGFLQATFAVFEVVFGAGFLLGPVRMLWLVPRLARS